LYAVGLSSSRYQCVFVCRQLAARKAPRGQMGESNSSQVQWQLRALCAVTLKHCALLEKSIYRFCMFLRSINRSCFRIGMSLISWSLQKRDTASSDVRNKFLKENR
jgi:hypothetical protein